MINQSVQTAADTGATLHTGNTSISTPGVQLESPPPLG